MTQSLELRAAFSPAIVEAFERLIDERVQAALVEYAENATPPYLTMKQAASYLQVSQKLLHRQIAAGHLPATRLGRRVLLRRGDLDALMRNGGEEG